jgi:hypothetical protein
MSHEDQLEIEVSAEIVEDISPEIKAPSAGHSFHLSPARSSAFSTPSRSPSRHSSFGAEDDLDDDVPSAVFSSFSQSPGATTSNPTTPDRKSRISTTVTISPKRGSSPGLSETETQPNTPSPDKTSSVVGSSTAGTPEHSPDRSAAVMTSPDRKCRISTTVTISPERGSSPELSETGMMASLHSTPERGIEGDQSAEGQTVASASPGASPGRARVSGGASLQSDTKATVTPNQSTEREVVVQSTPAKPKTMDETSEVRITVTPTQFLDREAVDQSAPVVQPRTLDDETRVASTTPVGKPERMEFSTEQSVPERDTLDISKTDPNDCLQQIAAGTSSEHFTVERTHTPEQNNTYAAVPAPYPEGGTPRVSNQESSYVESVSSGLTIGMQQAFDSLRTYMKVETDPEPGAGILDTSMESDGLTDSDIEELAKEIRELNESEDEQKDQKEMKGGEKQSSPQTSTGKKPAHAPVTLSRAALPSRSPAAVLSRSRTRKERMERINSNTALAAAMPNPPPEARTKNKATESSPSTAPSTQASSVAPPATVPSTETRASMRNDGSMTPVMRMRTTGSPQAPEVEPSPPRGSDEEVKAIKQRKWKDKLKLAEKKKEEERRMLDGRGHRKEGEAEKGGRGRSEKRSKERRKKSSKKKSQAPKKAREKDADAKLMQCSDGFSKLMETVMQGRCGALNDTFSIFDEGSETDDGSYESGSESGSEEYDQEEKGTSTDDGESEEEESELPVWKGGKRRSCGEGVRFEPEAHVAEKDAASASNQSHLSSELQRPIGRISLREEAIEDPNDVGIHDKNFIHSFITNATTKGTVLFLHKKSRKKSFTQPSKMTALLKLGPEQADGTFGGPKLAWMAYDGIQAGRIDLFDIRAVDKATPLQLQHYPLAMPRRSFVIKMNLSPDCVFEAMDEEAALRFVHGMRWVVARLAFNLIIGNMDVSCELLDIGRREDNEQKTRIPPQSPVEEAQWSMAMNSLTNHLVDKASLFTTQ